MKSTKTTLLIISLLQLLCFTNSSCSSKTSSSRIPTIEKSSVIDNNITNPSTLKNNESVLEKIIEPYSQDSKLILIGAKKCAQNKTNYTTGYFKINYPMGDIPSDKGVCTDVIVRSFRNAGYDLQELIHEDMKINFHQYPNIWGHKKPDSNIDHRRIPNIVTFLKKYGSNLTKEINKKTLNQWQPGDIVVWKLPNGLKHIGIISDKLNSKEVPYVIHNLGYTSEENVLQLWEITGHYRYCK